MNKITKIQQGKKNPNRVNVYIDNEYSFSVDMELVYKENLKVNQCVNIDKIKKIVDEDNFIKCKRSAIKIIERTYKTEKEIHDKLVLKEYEENIVEKTIEFLKEYKLINDEKFVKMYINDKIKTKGINKIKYELIKKGIKDDLINEQMSIINDDEVSETAYSLGLKKYNVLIKRENDKYKLSQKLYRFLIGKGYDYDLTSKIVKKIMEEER